MLLDYVILGVLLVAGLVAVLTSWIWVPALVISSPVWVPSLLVLAAFLHITGLKTYVTGGAQAVYNWAFYKSNRPRRYLWNKFYNVLCRMFPEVEWKTMNYGYAALSETGHLTKLQVEDEAERFSYQLYHLVASGFKTLNNLAGLHVLEVGSGRGGGLCYVFRYLKPASAFGVDYSPAQVEFCRRTYQIENLGFQVGDAENLSNIRDGIIDILINVESSHCYGNMPAFLREVERVLKPGGYFSFADFRGSDQVTELDAMIDATPLELQKKVDITKNVVKAMQLDSTRRTQLIAERTPWYTRGLLTKFAGVEGSNIFKQMEAGQTVYLGYLLTKPDN